jgi:hypothetical protein
MGFPLPGNAANGEKIDPPMGVKPVVTVIASEAKQSSFRAATRKLDCFVAALLAMTWRHTASFSQR